MKAALLCIIACVGSILHYKAHAK